MWTLGWSLYGLGFLLLALLGASRSAHERLGQFVPEKAVRALLAGIGLSGVAAPICLGLS